LLGQIARGWDLRHWKTENPTAAIALGIQTLRSQLFLAESLPLFWLQRPGRDAKHEPPPPEAVEVTLARLRALLERDAQEIGRGVVPLSVLAPRDPLGHGARLLRILADSTGVASRRRAHRHRDFGAQARVWLDELPAYYRRNFHHQTDGYLSERSADLYEHQVELLFRGGADAMRRLVLPPLRARFGAQEGRGLRFLELGAGTGAGTQAVAKAFPAAKITCLDLSYPYLKHAQKSLRDAGRIDFVQGDAANLEFQAERFDAVYSVFLFHELPLPIRESVVEEAYRVLKPRGLFSAVDSLQRGDDPELDWALDFFPREFHEPYYANYAANPLETLIRSAGFESIETGTGYLSKVVSAAKPLPEAGR
ncbi:MAG TPA: class I SAM-dependent methyltransferase, partial [Myxococcota bacterium]|nr:class I SAM-dependent methyltransferase [Myxococcota bacterium]